MVLYPNCTQNCTLNGGGYRVPKELLPNTDIEGFNYVCELRSNSRIINILYAYLYLGKPAQAGFC